MRRSVLSLLALLALAAPVDAMASKGSDEIIRQCANESISGTYTPDDYQEALDTLPADLKEYTDCHDVIVNAQRLAAGTHTPRNARGDGKPADPQAPSGTGGLGTTVTTATVGETTAPVSQPLTQASPADQAAAEAAQAQGAGALQVGGATITPGDPGTVVSSLDDLPTPILVLLALFVVGGLAGLGYALKRRVLGHRP